MTVMENTNQTEGRVSITAAATESTSSPGRRVPLIIPGAQEYFWHFEWQSGERAALAELEAGEGVLFDGDDPQDIARWLNDSDAADAG